MVDANYSFEWAPGVEIEEECAEDIVHENDIDKDQEIVQEIDEIRNEENLGEGAYITDAESISDNKDFPQDKIFGVLVNEFDDGKDRIYRTIKGINKSRYHSDKEELSIDSEDEVLIDDESDCEVEQPIKGARRLARINSGTGVNRLDPTNGGKTHNEVKRNILFLTL